MVWLIVHSWNQLIENWCLIFCWNHFKTAWNNCKKEFSPVHLPNEKESPWLFSPSQCSHFRDAGEFTLEIHEHRSITSAASAFRSGSWGSRTQLLRITEEFIPARHPLAKEAREGAGIEVLHPKMAKIQSENFEWWVNFTVDLLISLPKSWIL